MSRSYYDYLSIYSFGRVKEISALQTAVETKR